jgi:hypothetical protein
MSSIWCTPNWIFGPAAFRRGASARHPRSASPCNALCSESAVTMVPGRPSCSVRRSLTIDGWKRRLKPPRRRHRHARPRRPRRVRRRRSDFCRPIQIFPGATARRAGTACAPYRAAWRAPPRRAPGRRALRRSRRPSAGHARGRNSRPARRGACTDHIVMATNGVDEVLAPAGADDRCADHPTGFLSLRGAVRGSNPRHKTASSPRCAR